MDYLLYDGECPFCAEFVRMQRLREAGVSIVLLDARQNRQLVSEHLRAGRNIDDGMILKIGSSVYFGGDVLFQLALMSGSKKWVNRLFAGIFRRKSLSVLIYPILRSCRNATLRLRGAQKING